MALRRIGELVADVLGEIRWVRGGGSVRIDTFDESPEILYELLASAVESGLLSSMADVETIRVNGQLINRSSLT